jgi:hypothetical protein
MALAFGAVTGRLAATRAAQGERTRQQVGGNGIAVQKLKLLLALGNSNKKRVSAKVPAGFFYLKKYYQ